MSKPVIRVAIAGYGRSGCDIHARWLRQVPGRFRIVAVADELPKRRREAADAFGCDVYRDYRELLQRAKADLFVNALPSFRHVPASIEAFRAGFHVVCEKPLARRVKDFDRVVAAGAKARRLFAPFQNSRFNPGFRKLREIIDSGVLGDILHIRLVWSNFARRWDWQTFQHLDGGNLLNTGPHPMDLAVVLFGPRPPKVFCRMTSIQPFGGDAEDFCAVTLYDRGAPMIEVLISSYLAYPSADNIGVSGVYGGLTGNLAELRWKYFDPKKAPKQKMWRPWSDERRYCKETLPWQEKKWRLRPGKVRGFEANSRAFYRNLHDALTKGAALEVQPSEVRRQIAVIEECHRQNPLPKRK